MGKPQLPSCGFFVYRCLHSGPPQASENPETHTAVPPQGAGQTDEAYRAVWVDAIALIDKTQHAIKAQIHSAAITAKAEQGWGYGLFVPVPRDAQRLTELDGRRSRT